MLVRIHLFIGMFAAVTLFSCKKERSFEPGGTTGTTNGTLLIRNTSKFGSDSVSNSYTYNSNKQLISYKTGGTVFGTTTDSELKLERNSQGIIQKVILISEDLVQVIGTNTVERIVNYDAASSRYKFTVSKYFDGVDNVKDSAVYTYNTAGKISQVEDFYDDGSGVGYIKYTKTVYTYDGNGNIIKEKTLEFNPAAGGYQDSNEYAYEYDDKVNPLIMGNEAFILGETKFASSHNVTKDTYTDYVDTSNNDSGTLTYIYNTLNKPISAVLKTSVGISVPITYVYQ